MSKKLAFNNVRLKVDPAEAWIAQGAEREGRAPVSAAVPPPREDETRRTVRFTIDVNAELHTRIKVAAAQRGTRMADMLRAIFEREFPSS